MSTGFAVAAATAALADRLQALIGDAVPGARVTTLNPGARALRTGEPIVNLSLFRALRKDCDAGRDLPRRDGSGRLPAPPAPTLDLDYMITFFGDEAQLDPQRLLDLVAGGLAACPQIRSDEIRATVAATPWLCGTTLDEGETLRVTPMNLPPDAMVRLWSVFAQAPYQLTQLYTLTAVALAVPLPVAPNPPVRRLGPGTLGPSTAGAGPLPIAGIVDAANPDGPLCAGGVMAIRLAQPHDPNLSVRLDGREVRGTAGKDAAGQAALLVPLDARQPGPLRTGPMTVQVVRTRPGAGIVALSNPARVTILPALIDDPVCDPIRRAVELTLPLAVPGDAAVVLLLVPVPLVAAGNRLPARRLPLPLRSGDSVILRVDVSDIVPGRYHAAIEIDGLTSLPRHDREGDGPGGPILDLTARTASYTPRLHCVPTLQDGAGR